MVFNAEVGNIIVFVVLAVWNIGITYYLFRTIRHYNRLVAATSKTTLREALEELLEGKRQLGDHQKKLEKDLDTAKNAATYHLQRVGLVRFNPFSDTGGAQSFTMAILDGRDNGIVMTSLYARTGNRWYVKHVQAGKGVGIELSKEEQTAIAKAKHLTEEL